MKDGVTRNRKSAQLEEAICFEMEAAGLMNDFHTSLSESGRIRILMLRMRTRTQLQVVDEMLLDKYLMLALIAWRVRLR
jgi:hypothetical protein